MNNKNRTLGKQHWSEEKFRIETLKRVKCEEFVRSNAKTLERAKAAGIDIYAVIERFLKKVPSKPEGHTVDEVIRFYMALFDALAPFLNEYNVAIGIGQIKKENCDISIHDEDGIAIVTKFYEDKNVMEGTRDISKIHRYLYDPNAILQQLISIVIKKKEEKNRATIRDLKLSTSFIKILGDELAVESGN